MLCWCLRLSTMRVSSGLLALSTLPRGVTPGFLATMKRPSAWLYGTQPDGHCVSAVLSKYATVLTGTVISVPAFLSRHGRSCVNG